MNKMKTLFSLISIAMLVYPLTAGASPNDWPFDFDSQISQDPAYVDQRISEMSSGLPGLPATPMTEVTIDDVRLYFYQEMADAFFLARDSGPGFASPLEREPVLCQQHAAFSPPPLDLISSTPACVSTRQQIIDVFSDFQKPCLQVEFPETYVLEYQAGPIPPSTLTSFEGLISLAGEALMHVDFQENLFADDLITETRNVIAKLRFEPLQDAIADQKLEYQTVLDALQAAPGCFDSAEVAALSASISGLLSELSAAQQSLIVLFDAGLAQAAQDKAALEAMGRERDDLLHPALTDHERLLLSFYIGGLYWRMRGAGLVAEPPDPDQGLLRRLYFVQYPYQLIGELNAGLADADRVGQMIFIQENWGYSDWMDMGTTPGGRDKYADLVDMTNRGKRATLLVAPMLSSLGYDVRDLVYGGLQMGPCYYYAWEELRNYQLGPDLQYPYMWFLEGPTAIGEFCTGASLALGLARTLLWGKPGEACVGDCSGRECGDDGCGISCGSCVPQETCTQGTCQPCTADCSDKLCGDDGCSGSCGECFDYQICQQGQCVCVPDCTDSICGDDGCGGSCGQCIGNTECQQGLCVCVPDCTDRLCGDDGCGGLCGTCGDNEVCQLAQCVCLPKCDGFECGDDGCGGSCGTCAPDTTCRQGSCVATSSDGGVDGCAGEDCATPAEGCSCQASDGTNSGWLLFFLFGLYTVLSRRRTRLR
jgi:MYXO-CTERM domain-containing protein